MRLEPKECRLQALTCERLLPTEGDVLVVDSLKVGVSPTPLFSQMTRKPTSLEA